MEMTCRPAALPVPVPPHSLLIVDLSGQHRDSLLNVGAAIGAGCDYVCVAQHDLRIPRGWKVFRWRSDQDEIQNQRDAFSVFLKQELETRERAVQLIA